MFKRTLKAFLIASAAFVLAACGGQAHAANNAIATADGKVFSVYDVRTITVAGGGFQIKRDSTNTPDVIADSTGAIFASARLTAPALKNLVQLGTSGVWLNTDTISYAWCQYGTSVPSSPVLTGGTHLFVVWQGSGYTMFEDSNCATATVIRNASSH